MKVKVLVAQSCPTFCDPMDCGPPGSSVRGIFQARMLSDLPFPSPGDLPYSGIKPRSPALQADSLLPGPPGKLVLPGFTILRIYRCSLFNFFLIFQFISEIMYELIDFPVDG